MKYPLLQGLRWCMLSMAVSASAQVSAPVASTQLPTGGKVMSGTTSIQSVGNVLNINQTSQRSAINWNTFNVGSGAKVNFIQPSASSVTLNRVLDTNGSQILGSINANGQVFISNPNGVLFGPNSQVNVGGLIATTQNISVDDFMAGKSTFEGTGAAGAVVNQGTLEAALGGYIALLAPSVRNEGVVLAREGTVAFAAGDKTVVQFNGPQLVSVMVDRSVLDALVENKQIVRADGGLVIFSARSANAVLSSVIRNTGAVQANTIVNRQGRIMLEGGSQGVVEVGGTLQASGVDAGTQGGTISATGDKVSVVSGALLDATGQAGGGNVLVGGGWQGGDPTIQSANAVNIASGAVLNASAIQNGKGGTVVAWSDTQNSAGVTKVQGALLARGGAEGGDGGRIETSGRWISTSGASGDAGAIKGTGGQWLFDPYDVDIVATPSTTNQATNSSNTWSPIGNGSTILNSDITNLLNAGTSVTVLVPTTGGGGLSGNIKVSAPIIQQAASPSANLTLSAYRNLLIDQPITLSGSTGTLQLTAGTGSSAQGYISIDNAVTANTVSVDNFASGPVTQSVAISANNLRINAPLSNVTLSNTSNQIGALAANVQSLSIKTSQGVDKGSLYGSGMAIGIVGDLTGVTASGDISMSVLNGNLFIDKSISTASTSSTALKLNAGSSLNTGSYSGTNSVNNPYGPNIILASDFSSTSQSISVGSGGKGLLYTGGYGNSGVSLATYLGSNKSRYNSNESITNFSTAAGTGLTAIYRQNPSMVVTGPSASTTYGTAATLGTNSISGLANSDTSAGMTVGTYSHTSSLSNSGNQKAGSYSVVPTGASNGLGYGISYTNGTLSVAQKALTYVSGIAANDKTYDRNTVATIDTSNVVISGNITNDVITGGSAQGAFANKNAASGKIVTLSNPILYGTDAANYSVTLSQITTTATINQAPAIVTAGSLSTTYSGTTQFILGSNFTATGLVGGETKSVLTAVSASGSGLNAGSYATTASGTDTNYSLTYIPGSLVVNPAPLTVTASNRSKTYGDTLTFTGTEFTTSGLQNSQTATSATLTTSGSVATAAASTSPYTITPSALTGGTFNSSNYAITYVNGALTVNKAPLTITANSFTKTYGDTITLTGNEFSTSGLKNSETASTATLTTTGAVATAPYSSTPYSVTPSAITGANGFNTSNYTITYVNGGINVSQAPLSVTANNYIKTYGDLMTFSGTEFSTSGLKNSETATNATITSLGAPASASYSSSAYATTPSALTGGTFNASNYSITYNAGGLTVNKAPLTVTANSFTKSYGDTITFAGSEFSASGLKNNETATTATLTSSGAAANAAFSSSPYAVMTSGLTGGTFSSNNYNITYSNGGLRVNKANATVVGLSGSTEFDGTTKTLTGFTATGLVNGETTGDIARSAFNTNGVSASTSGRFSGTYSNTPFGTANNYNLNFVSGKLLITGCPGGPPCSAIGPQTTASNITPVVIPAMTAPSFSSAVVTTTAPTNSAAPVINFASSSGGGSFSSGGGSTTISNTNTTISSVNPNNVTTSSGNPTTNASPVVPTTTTTIVNAGATPANPPTNVVNIAANAPSGSTTPSQVNVAQGNTTPTSSPNTVITTTQNPTSPVAISAAPNNTAAVSASPNPATTVNTVNTTTSVNVQTTAGKNQAPTNIASTPTTNAATPQPTAGVVVVNNNPNASQVNTAAAQPNVVTPQRLADILSKKDPVEISSALPPTQVAQLSPEQVAPLIDSLSMRQLMSLTNEQIAKFDPARQAELLNIIKVLKDNPEKAAEKAFTPTDKTFAQLAANGLLKEQIDTLSSRVTQINQNRSTVNIDTPQKLAELLTKKDPVEIATALPSNQVAQLTPEQAAPLISSLTVRQLLALTNEQIAKFEPARQAELLNIINVIKNNPEKAADKAYTAIDKTTAQYVANGLMKDQIDALASKVTQLTQSKTTINIDTPQKLAEILNKNNAVEVATALPSNVVPQLTSDQVAPLINALSVKQLLSLTNEQISKLNPARLAELLNIIKGLKDTPEKAIDKTYTPEDKAIAQYAANGLLKDPIERLSLRANYIANNKSVDPLNKELADLTNPPVPANIPVARNAPNQANRPLNAAQLAAQNANRETPNLTPAQVAALNPKDLGPLLSQLNANQLMAITNAQMASLEGSYLNQLTILLNFVQDRASNPVANATPAAGGNRLNNTNIFINQPVAKLAGAALLADQPNAALPTAPIPAPNPVLAGVGLTPKQVSELDPAQLAPLINQLNANQLMAITNAQMARMDGRALNQLTILMNFVQQRAANNNGTANGNNPANAGTNTNTNINVFVNQPVSRLASNALLNEQPKPNAPVAAQSFTQTNITVNLTPRQISELDPAQLAPLISQLNANQLMAITNTQMARMDSLSINQLNILMNFVQQRALNSNTNTTIYTNQPVSQIVAASLMNDQPPPTQIAGAAPAPIATVPLSPQQIAGLTPSQVAPLLNRMNSRQLMAVTDTQMASLDSANLNQLITLLNFIQDSARTSPIVTNNFANRPVAGFLPPELNTTQTLTQP